MEILIAGMAAMKPLSLILAYPYVHPNHFLAALAVPDFGQLEDPLIVLLRFNRFKLLRHKWKRTRTLLGIFTGIRLAL